MSCTGSQFCGVAIIETKNRAMDVVAKLEQQLDFPTKVRMHWTGCPNSCGQVSLISITPVPFCAHAARLVCYPFLPFLAVSVNSKHLHELASSDLDGFHRTVDAHPRSLAPTDPAFIRSWQHAALSTCLCSPRSSAHSVRTHGAPRCMIEMLPAYAQVQVADIGLMGGPAKLDGKAVEGVRIFLGGTIGENPKLAEQFEKGIACDETVLLPKLKDLLVEHFGATPKASAAMVGAA